MIALFLQRSWPLVYLSVLFSLFPFLTDSFSEFLSVLLSVGLPLEAFEALFLGKRDKDSWDPRPSLPDEVFVKEEVLELAGAVLFFAFQLSG